MEDIVADLPKGRELRADTTYRFAMTGAAERSGGPPRVLVSNDVVANHVVGHPDPEGATGLGRQAPDPIH